MPKLTPNPNNPRTISKEAFEQLKGKIQRNPDGLSANKIVYKDGVIIAGNQRWRAIQDLKLEVKDDWLKDVSGWTDEQIREYLVTSNISDGDWDWDTLLNEYDPQELDDWGLEVPGLEDDKEIVEDEAPEVTEDPVSELGKIYQLGKHRVMCGDSTTDLDTLLDGAKIDLVHTDPPYGIDADKMTMGSGAKQFHRGKWDSAAPDVTYLLELADKVCIWGGNYFTDKLPINNDWLCWHKKNDNLSFSEFELAWTNYGKNTRHISHHWGAEKKQHVTMKPVEVCAWAIKLAGKDKTVLDTYLGSGSTLIACEQTDRTCYGMELDCRYVDVIRKRYAKFIQPDNQLPENWEELTPEVTND